MVHKSKTNNHSITKIGRRVSHDMLHYASVSRSKIKVTGRLTETRKMCHIFGTVRPKTSKLVRIEDVDPHRRQAP